MQTRPRGSLGWAGFSRVAILTNQVEAKHIVEQHERGILALDAGGFRMIPLDRLFLLVKIGQTPARCTGNDQWVQAARSREGHGQ